MALAMGSSSRPLLYLIMVTYVLNSLTTCSASGTSDDKPKKEPKPEKPRELFEIAAEKGQKVGLTPFYEGNMEPTGVVLVGYVKAGSPNHKLLKKLGSSTRESDPEIFELLLPMAAGIDWHEEESLELVKRSYAQKLWENVKELAMDAEPVRYAPDNPDKPWKLKDVRRWIMENAYPTINYRVLNYRQKRDAFPVDKYFGKGNIGNVGLFLLDIGKDWDFAPQFQAARLFRPYMEQLLWPPWNMRFAVLEKSKKTLELRTNLKVGLDESIAKEFVIIEDPCMSCDKPVDNFAHGNPKKYRLKNFTEEGVKEFFATYKAGNLPTYWGSKHEGSKMKSKSPHEERLFAWNFEEFIYKQDSSKGVLVAFFNEDPNDGCMNCEEGMKVWEQVAKEIHSKKKKEFKRLVLASIDQSANEHPENLIPGKVSGPMMVWYPPGTESHRRKKKQVMHAASEHPSFTKDELLERIRDLLFDLEENEKAEL